MKSPARRALILDDDEARHLTFKLSLPNYKRRHVRTAKQAILAIEKEPRFDVIYLDHNLEQSGPHAGTGMDVAKYLAHEVDPDRYPDHVYIHSQNRRRSSVMARVMRRSGLVVTLQPFRA
jgi:CheY-like chemotaxis protein